MKNNNKLQEGLDSLERMRLLMGYDSKKTLTENKQNIYNNNKSFLSEALVSTKINQTTKSEPTPDEIAEVFSGNKIKNPSGGFTTVDTTIEIISVLNNQTTTTEGWQPNSWFTGQTKQLYSNEDFRKFLNIPSVGSFRDEDGVLYLAQFNQDRDLKNHPYNGWYFKGYKMVQGDNSPYIRKKKNEFFDPLRDAVEGQSDVEITYPIINESNISGLKPGQVLVFQIKNLNERPLKINGARILPPKIEGLNPEDWVGEEYLKLRDDGVAHRDFDANPNGPNPMTEGIKTNEIANVDVDIPFDTPQEFLYVKADKNSLGGPYTSYLQFILEVDTSEGKIFLQFPKENVGIETRQEVLQRMYKEKAENRKTIHDIDVPDNFSAFCYEDFLSELYDRLIEQPCAQAAYPYYEKYFPQNNDYITKKFPLVNYIENKDPKEVGENCYKYFDEIIKKYKDVRFANGICPERKKQFIQAQKDAISKLDKIMKKCYKSTGLSIWVEDWNDKSMVTNLIDSYANCAKVGKYTINSDDYQQPTKTEQNKLCEDCLNEFKQALIEKNGINDYYKFDDRDWFDKFWDKWGLWIQLGAAAITTIITLGATSEFTILAIARVLGTTAARVTAAFESGVGASTMMEFILNAGVGTYQWIKGDSREAILSFFFAALPKIHEIYGGVGKYFATPEELVTKSLSKKVAAQSWKSAEDMEAFAKTLKQTAPKESEIFETAMKLGKEEFEGSFDALEKYVKNKLLGSKWSRFVKGTRSFVGTAGIDFLLIETAQEVNSKVVDVIRKNCKKCFPTPEEKKASIYIEGLSQDNLDALKFMIDRIGNSDKLNSEQKGKMLANLATGDLNPFVEKTAELIKIQDENKALAELDKMINDWVSFNVNQQEDEDGIYYLGTTYSKNAKGTKYSKELFLKLKKNKTLPRGYWKFSPGWDDDVYDAFHDTQVFEDIPDNLEDSDVLKRK